MATIVRLLKRKERERMLDQLRRDITTRLDGLLSEVDKLRHALTVLGPGRRDGGPSATATSAPRPQGSRSTTAAPTRVSARKAPGATKAAVLAALGGGDAMTAGDVAASTGIDRATVSTTLSRLAKTGEVTKASRGYRATQPAAAPFTPSTGRSPK